MEQKSRIILAETSTNTRLGDINAQKNQRVVQEVLYNPGNSRNGIESQSFRK